MVEGRAQSRPIIFGTPRRASLQIDGGTGSVPSHNIWDATAGVPPNWWRDGLCPVPLCLGTPRRASLQIGGGTGSVPSHNIWDATAGVPPSPIIFFDELFWTP